MSSCSPWSKPNHSWLLNLDLVLWQEPQTEVLEEVFSSELRRRSPKLTPDYISSGLLLWGRVLGGCTFHKNWSSVRTSCGRNEWLQGVSSSCVWKDVAGLETSSILPLSLTLELSQSPGPLHSTCGHCKTASVMGCFNFVTFIPIRQNSCGLWGYGIALIELTGKAVFLRCHLQQTFFFSRDALSQHLCLPMPYSSLSWSCSPLACEHLWNFIFIKNLWTHLWVNSVLIPVVNSSCTLWLLPLLLFNMMYCYSVCTWIHFLLWLRVLTTYFQKCPNSIVPK